MDGAQHREVFPPGQYGNEGKVSDAPYRGELLRRLVLAELVQGAFSDAGADEVADVAAEHADFLDEAGRDELLAFGRHQEHGLDIRVELGVHAGHLEFVFEVGHGAQSPNN